MVKNTNDGTSTPPYIRFDISGGNLFGLPETSTAPRGEIDEILAGVKAAGFDGIQCDATLAAEAARHGLRITGGARIDNVGEADGVAAAAKAAGYDCVTLHVGWGLEGDEEVFALVEDILTASAKRDIPLYIETHRATITQDIWRTVKLTEKFPEIRFNGDFSHWYTGLEMVYGGIDKKLAFAAPVLERVRFIHGRIGNPGSIQVGIEEDSTQPYVDHFRDIWTRCFAGFQRTAQPGDYISFTPELLAPGSYYARIVRAPDGTLAEESDRRQQALLYKKIATECWEAAKSAG